MERWSTIKLRKVGYGYGRAGQDGWMWCMELGRIISFHYVLRHLIEKLYRVGN